MIVLKKYFFLIVLIGVIFTIVTIKLYQRCNDQLINSKLIIKKSVENPLEIKHLDLSGSKSRKFPSEVFEYVNLESLQLDNTNFDSLPEEISQLKSLRHLSIENSQVSYIPITLFDLTKLEYLNLFGNKLTTLPDKFDNLKSLKKMALCNNQIKSIPNSIWEILSLEELCIDVSIEINLCQTVGKNKNLIFLEISPISGINSFNKKQKLDLERCLPDTKILW